jgi:hypothetical protein
MMNLKSLAFLFPGAFLCLTTNVWAKGDLPSTEPFSHYAPMVKRSPFAVASAGAPVGAKPDFAKDLYVANAAHSTDGDFVTIASTTDKNLKEYLNTKETIDGYSISNIQWSDRVGETKVTITKDGQFATLTFNEALLSQAIQNAIPPQVQPVPLPGNHNTVRNGVQPQIQRPMPVPQIPTPPPHVRPTIHRRNVPNQPQPGQQRGQTVKQVETDDDDFDN